MEKLASGSKSTKPDGPSMPPLRVEENLIALAEAPLGERWTS